MPCLIGCLIVFVVVLVLAVVAGIWIARNWPSFLAMGTEQILNQSMEDADLPAQRNEREVDGEHHHPAAPTAEVGEGQPEAVEQEAAVGQARQLVIGLVDSELGLLESHGDAIHTTAPAKVSSAALAIVP